MEQAWREGEPPFDVGARVGSLSLTFKGKEIGSYPLVANEPVGEASFFGRSVDAVKLWFH